MPGPIPILNLLNPIRASRQTTSRSRFAPPSGISPSGAFPSGTSPSGTTPSGTSPFGISPAAPPAQKRVPVRASSRCDSCHRSSLVRTRHLRSKYSSERTQASSCRRATNSARSDGARGRALRRRHRPRQVEKLAPCRGAGVPERRVTERKGGGSHQERVILDEAQLAAREELALERVPAKPHHPVVKAGREKVVCSSGEQLERVPPDVQRVVVCDGPLQDERLHDGGARLGLGRRYQPSQPAIHAPRVVAPRVVA
eukprot:scaffold155_cov106-Isochrysis_galbana.AAC.4